MGARVLITGGAGFVGSHLAARLAGESEVRVLDDLSVGRREHVPSGAELVVGDLADPAALARALEGVEVVYHLAARHFIPACDADPVGTLRVNVLGTQALLCALPASVRALVFASTAAVYAPAAIAHREEDAAGPTDVYGRSKWFGEALVRASAVPTVVARLFNVYGVRETNPHLIPDLLAQLARGAVKLGNLVPARDYVDARDAAEALARLASHATPGGVVVNVGTGREATVREVVQLVARAAGRPLAIEVDPARQRRSDREHLRADSTRLHRLTGLAPFRSLEEGLADLVRAP